MNSVTILSTFISTIAILKPENQKNKAKGSYPDIPSAVKPVPHPTEPPDLISPFKSSSAPSSMLNYSNASILSFSDASFIELDFKLV